MTTNNPPLTSGEPRTALLALDWGTRRVGCAVASGIQGTPVPYGIISNTVKLFEALTQIVAEQRIGTIVFGLPTHLEGQATDLVPKIRALADRLRRELALNVVFEDERLTSRAADALMKGTGHRRRHHDDIAAQIILAGYLARHHQEIK